MYSVIKPYGAVKEHERDYLISKGNRWFINTNYAGLVEIEKKEFERLVERGMEVK